MPDAIFRITLPDGRIVLAGGASERGPDHLLPANLTIDKLLSDGVGALVAAAAEDLGGPDAPPDAQLLAPIGTQEVWAAGVTYGISRVARIEESEQSDVYARVWGAERPELFFKSCPSRAVGPGEAIGVRRDSDWNVPEPELALALTPEMNIAGYTIGNDVSSRSIEGENPLYLPQAKIYERACALGPCLVPATAVSGPFEMRLTVEREGETVVELTGSTSHMVRSFEELAAYLGSALSFPVGAILLTGTGVVPARPFNLLEEDVVEVSIGGLGTLRNPVVTVGRSALA